MAEWKKTEKGNSLLAGDGFEISYREDCRSVEVYQAAIPFYILPFVDVAKMLGDTDEETALHKLGTSEWFVLNGDWRADYERLAPQGYEACLEFFLTKMKEGHASSLTDTPTMQEAP